MSKSRLELLKKELLEGDKGNYSTFSVRFSGYSARQLLNEIEFLQKRGESGKVAKKARRRARKTEALARALVDALETAIDIVDEDGSCKCDYTEGEYPYYCDRCKSMWKVKATLDEVKEELGSCI